MRSSIVSSFETCAAGTKAALFFQVTAAMLALAATAAFAQPDPGQPRSTRAPHVDAETREALEAAIASVQAGRHAEARASLDRLDLAKLSPYERSRVEQILFNVAYAEQRFDDADRHLDTAVAAGGLNAQEASQARYQQAQLLMAQERWSDGAAALEQWFATAVSPNPAAHYLLAVAYYHLEDFDGALAPAQRAVDLMTDPQESWLGLLLSLRLQKQEYRDAVPLLQKLVAIAPGKKSYWVQLSATYGQLEDYDGALATLQGAYGIGLLTEDAEIRRLADLLVFLDAPARAAQVLESALRDEIVVPDSRLYETLANAWASAGNAAQALGARERAADLASSGEAPRSSHARDPR